jgi:cyclic-di-GMP-binding protein
MPSFDTVSEMDMHELSNAVDQANREVTTRYDFKGVGAQFDLKKDRVVMSAEVDFQLKQMLDILHQKLAKRGVDLKHLQIEEPELLHKKATQVIQLQQGISTEQAKKIVKLIKAQKFKVQASIQGDQVRVTGKKRDDLQSVMAFLKAQELDLPLQFNNFRD